MKIGILGTGSVGRAHAQRLTALGHDVVLGTQDVAATMASIEKDAMGTEPFQAWHTDNQGIKLVTFNEAAEHGEVVIDALKGEVALSILSPLASALAGKVLIDIANPLDFSKGMPPTLLICNTESLGERIQTSLADVKVVKAFNTVAAHLQVNPQQLAGGDHTLFLCGNDAQAKATVHDIAAAYGWKHIIDVGDISSARGTEMLLPLWVRLWGALKSPTFNFKIVQ